MWAEQSFAILTQIAKRDAKNGCSGDLEVQRQFRRMSKVK
jgi:hypothetical protein